MGIRHVVEVKVVGGSETGNDPYFFYAQQNEDAPQHINELDSNKQQPQGEAPVRGTPREAHAVVTNEHGAAFPVKRARSQFEDFPEMNSLVWIHVGSEPRNLTLIKNFADKYVLRPIPM